MRPLARPAAAAMIFALALAAQAGAQGSDPGPCRQGVLALILMIDAEEQDRSHYRSTAASVVEACGSPPAAKASMPAPAFDKAACGKLAQTMLDSIEAGKMSAPEFVAARNSFAQQCRGG